MDKADYGNQNAEFYRQQALAEYSRRNGRIPRAAQQHPGDDPLGNNRVGVEGPRACLDCEDEIDPARIKANPEAVRCIDCQTKWERRR